MASLYVTSFQKGAGKTLVCAGLGKHFLIDRKKVGFFKPIIVDEKGSAPTEARNDAEFMKKILSLAESVEDMCPVLTKDKLADVSQAYTKVAEGKDVVIVEGIVPPSGEIIKALEAKVLVVEDYGGKLAIDNYKSLGKSLLGVVVNKVPKNKVEPVQSEVSAKLSQVGVSLLGVLPEDRVLFAITVGELAESLKGKILNSADKSAELLENLMLGAMTVDPGPLYYGRKNKKAVLVRADRPDMQLAALQTSTTCLVLSGDAAPIPAVMRQAEAKKVPIISAKGDMTALASSIEDALTKARFNQEKKLPRLTEMVEKRLNFTVLYQGLALAE